MGVERYPRQCYGGVFIGYGIRGSIGGDVTFRVRRGNGFYNSILGHRYQDRFTLVVPGSINNPESDPYRATLRAAVHHWQFALTDAEKKRYNRRAGHGLQMSGYNLFIREALKGKVEMYINRGDPATFDFDKNDFTDDGTWRELDLSTIIPDYATCVLLQLEFQANNVGDEIAFKRYGQSNDINQWNTAIDTANRPQRGCGLVATDHNRKILYKIDASTWDHLNVCIRGWWI